MWHLFNTSDGVYIFTKFVTITVEAERRSAHIIIEHYPPSTPLPIPLFLQENILRGMYWSAPSTPFPQLPLNGNY